MTSPTSHEKPSSSQRTQDGNGIAKTVELGFNRTTSHYAETGPPPDGGKEAWLQVACAHVTIFNTWGFLNSFG